MFQNLSNLTKAVLFYVVTLALSLPLIWLSPWPVAFTDHPPDPILSD